VGGVRADLPQPLEGGDETALLERILEVAPVIIDATKDFETVGDNFLSGVFKACVER
jgi:hypothetical protein